MIDTAPPMIVITAPDIVSNTGITTTTIRVTDDIAIYATGVIIS